ncbi:single-stranded DNA-binding protein [symbiont of Argiope bruennichi]|uniref:single-stranded DNA-binding protein n=1 Tax=symbiont of Argiope bruennichi TaxID=2810479 RepID=UPI003DA342AF
MNKVFLTGNLINIRTSANPKGNLNAYVTIAPANWRKKTDQNQKTLFLTVNFFDVSQNYLDNLKKARIISIEGHISTYNQKVTEEKIIKSLSIISDRCHILLYKKLKSDDQNENFGDFKVEEPDFIYEKEAKSETKDKKNSSDGDLDNLEETIFLNDDEGLF